MHRIGEGRHGTGGQRAPPVRPRQPRSYPIASGPAVAAGVAVGLRSSAVELAALSLLLVDDDPEPLARLARGLRAAGHAVAVARDGDEALAAARAAPPDAILAGVTLPGLNGFQLCRRLHAAAETAHVPVFLMSTRADPAEHLWAGEVGAAALLAKPLDPREALARFAIARVGGRRQ